MAFFEQEHIFHVDAVIGKKGSKDGEEEALPSVQFKISAVMDRSDVRDLDGGIAELAFPDFGVAFKHIAFEDPGNGRNVRMTINPEERHYEACSIQDVKAVRKDGVTHLHLTILVPHTGDIASALMDKLDGDERIVFEKLQQELPLEG